MIVMLETVEVVEANWDSKPSHRQIEWIFFLDFLNASIWEF